MMTTTSSFYKETDKKREADKIIQMSLEYCAKRAKHKLDKINREWQKDIIDKQEGNTYQSRMTGPSTTNNRPSVDVNGLDENGVKIKFCKACKKYGRMRRTSLQCTKNPKSQYYTTAVEGTYIQYH
jgi:hypothetical protein